MKKRHIWFPAKAGRCIVKNGRFVKMSEEPKKELAVITMAKELAKYVMTVTQKSPKHFRFSLVAKLQSLSIEAVEYMYRANDFFVSNDRRDEYDKRLSCQRQARE